MRLIEQKEIFKKYRLALFFLAMVGSIFILVTTSRFGVGISPDSVGYISTARNIMAGVGILTYDGVPLVSQPPLYSTLLALIGIIFGQDPLLIARFLNAALFGLIIYLGGILTFKHFSSSPVIAFIGGILILFSSPLVAVTTMAWSEPLFIVFVLLTLIYADCYYLKKDAHSLIFLSIAVSLSCLTRYIGNIFLFCIPLIILILSHHDLKTKMKHLITFLMISVLPLAIWLIRNYVISKTLFGPRASADCCLSHNFACFYQTLSTWYIPRVIVKHPIIYTYMSMAACIFTYRTLQESWENIKIRLTRTFPVLLFVITYTLFIIISSTTIAYDQIGDRLLSPIYIPLTLLLLILVYSIFEPFRRHLHKNLVNIYLIIGITIWAIYPIATTLNNARNSYELGHEFSGVAWRDSETIQYLRQQRIRETKYMIYTNCPEALYILLDKVSKSSPARTKYNSSEKETDLSELFSHWPENNPAYLVWFDRMNRGFLYKISELRKVANFSQIAHLKDGVIYSVTKK